jgi:hypothetical protein
MKKYPCTLIWHPLHHPWHRCKICHHEDIIQWNDASNCNNDGDCKQHKTTTLYDPEWKTMPKVQLPTGLIIRCHTTRWTTEEMMMNWIQVVWNRKATVLMRKWGMLVLYAFKGHLQPEVTLSMQCTVISWPYLEGWHLSFKFWCCSE